MEYINYLNKPAKKKFTIITVLANVNIAIYTNCIFAYKYFYDVNNKFNHIPKAPRHYEFNIIKIKVEKDSFV